MQLMNTMTITKAAGAIISAALFVLLANWAASAIFGTGEGEHGEEVAQAHSESAEGAAEDDAAAEDELAAVAETETEAAPAIEETAEAEVAAEPAAPAQADAAPAAEADAAPVETAAEPAASTETVATAEAEPAAADAATAAAAGGSGVAALLASADAAAGEKGFGKCKSCHKMDGKNGVGPHLDGVVGRAMAGVEGYKYSPAMIAHASVDPTWTPEALDAFLENPKGYVPKTKMSFAGIKDAQDRADMIAYLQANP